MYIYGLSDGRCLWMPGGVREKLGSLIGAPNGRWETVHPRICMESFGPVNSTAYVSRWVRDGLAGQYAPHPGALLGPRPRTTAPSVPPKAPQVGVHFIIFEDLSHSHFTRVQFAFLTPQVPHFSAVSYLHIISEKTFVDKEQRWRRLWPQSRSKHHCSLTPLCGSGPKCQNSMMRSTGSHGGQRSITFLPFRCSFSSSAPTQKRRS